MNSFSTILATTALLGLAVLPASAQTAPTVNKTWVSSTGSDTGSCQLVAPCKTFAYAISETNANGEVDVKDAGAYGAFTITKAINIIADGVLASVGAGTNGYGIDIEAGANDHIVLRGLLVDTHYASGYGIYINTAGGVAIDHCIIQNNPDGVAAVSGFVMISNTLITGSAYGAAAFGTSNIFLSNDVITLNEYGLLYAFNSYGNNSINGNYVCDTCKGTVTRTTAE